MASTVSRRAIAAVAAAAASIASSDRADATTFNETTDFGNTFGTRTLLPLGTDVVNGSVFDFEGDPADFVTFHGLGAGASFDLHVTNGGGQGNLLTTTQFDDSGGALQGDAGTSVFLSGTVPNSGALNFGMSVQGGVFYTLALTVPEPSRTEMLGTGVLGVLAVQRVRRRRSA
jgi:hypothetical protein